MGRNSGKLLTLPETQPPSRLMGREPPRLSSCYSLSIISQQLLLQLCITISLHEASATAKLPSPFKLNILKRAEISILHLFTDEKTFPNRQQSRYFFNSKDGQLFPVISITFLTYYFMVMAPLKF
jgi:hypothetical protein